MGAEGQSVPHSERIELLELYGRLAFAIDSGEATAWAAMFTPDGVLRTSRPRELHGREEIADFAAEWFASSGAQRRHVSWHHSFEQAGEEVLGRCYASVLRSDHEGVTPEFTAVYRDRFVRENGGWLLRERDVAIDPQDAR